MANASGDDTQHVLSNIIVSKNRLTVVLDKSQYLLVPFRSQISYQPLILFQKKNNEILFGQRKKYFKSVANTFA